jgi:hypothetical protein
MAHVTNASVQTAQAAQTDKTKKKSWGGFGKGCYGEGLREELEELERRGGERAALLLLLILEHCGHQNDRGHDKGPRDHTRSKHGLVGNLGV